MLRPQPPPPPSPRPSQRLPSSSGTDLDTSPAMFTGRHSRPGGLCCTPPTALCPGAARRPQAQPRHPGPVGGCSDCPPLCLALQDCPAQPDPEWAAMVPWGHHAGLSPCPSPPPTPRATGPGIFRPPSARPAGTATGGPAGAARPGAPHRPGRHSPLGKGSVPIAPARVCSPGRPRVCAKVASPQHTERKPRDRAPGGQAGRGPAGSKGPSREPPRGGAPVPAGDTGPSEAAEQGPGHLSGPSPHNAALSLRPLPSPASILSRVPGSRPRAVPEHGPGSRGPTPGLPPGAGWAAPISQPCR